MDDREYQMLSRQIADLLGLDLDVYKPAQMRRRISTFIDRSGCENTAAFVTRIQREPELLDDLRDLLTINVTEFFRDSAPWRTLRETALPAILARNPSPKVWSAGCSHGGEPYSVSMLLQEAGAGPTSSVIATDIDPRVLKKARDGGPYALGDVTSVPTDIWAKYFREDENGLWVTDDVRRRVKFRELNLHSDVFPSSMDLILCRNVIIYFTKEFKDQLMQQFQRSLAPGGILFIEATSRS
jgi:chemotaxis protein methyltransferase CheR